ncbi:hypothetical protein A3I25_01415 [Candidatus Nomurabacteria bacterium RIFCSPLOWO2_02_FULL_42_17]|uniref:Transposase IS200-like domain-containing protein n=1 Tax=Candidatus Nomurabacteria bacterium RIFCSPLOWO2_02_FULL_42_17 TaxID=1801789 RepID=A0A1F6XRM2_9BACT|nr:MAG: hypothetical protein UX37_C0010G0014 [Microgenomates group bacterium GW2011_GWA2_46_16]OGI96799.1 MAG: hypothetical protein A3I25_01415 [Candidatus Nomurabacteria bacterium RIFCSPLOWO2_02_FULL_42_17]
MLRKTSFTKGENYHCYTRGTDKRKIFLDKGDYIRFIVLLYICNSTQPIHISNFESKKLMEFFDLEKERSLVAIGTYCLMPNHIHLLLQEVEKGGLSLFMKKLLTAYSMYFNKKYQRKGVLFEGCFKAEHINEDRYLKYLFSYIHLNPVKLIDSKWKERGLKNLKQAKGFLRNYEYSSYLDYLGIERPQNKILNLSAFPNYFENIKDFWSEIFEWLSFGEDFSRQGPSLP